MLTMLLLGILLQPATAPAGSEVTLPSGLKYVDLPAAAPLTVQSGDTITVHYTGKLTDGTVFDTSRKPRQRSGLVEPFQFTVGQKRVIAGWEEGFLGMKVNDRRILTVPPELGYGDRGSGKIPGGATLIFDVEVIGISRPDEGPR